MSPSTVFRVVDAATEAIAERHIRRLTQLLRVPSVASSLHLSERYRNERSQWQQAIDQAQKRSGQ
jgi:hypothetical protein